MLSYYQVINVTSVTDATLGNVNHWFTTRYCRALTDDQRERILSYDPLVSIVPEYGPAQYCHVLWHLQSVCFSCLYSAVPLKRVNFVPKSSQTSHSSPVRARYGLSVVILKSDSFSVAAITVPYVTSRQIGPRYNGTWLYFNISYYTTFPTTASSSHWRIRMNMIL